MRAVHAESLAGSALGILGRLRVRFPESFDIRHAARVRIAGIGGRVELLRKSRVAQRAHVRVATDRTLAGHREREVLFPEAAHFIAFRSRDELFGSAVVGAGLDFFASGVREPRGIGDGQSLAARNKDSVVEQNRIANRG